MMKKLFLALLVLAMPLAAKEHDFTLYPPNVPTPHIVEADPPQTNTFCAANLSCAITGAWTFPSIGNVAIKATTAQAIRFVANDGNDANDGLSWGSAKLTIAAACATIPGQDATCTQVLGVGTLYVADTFSGSYPAGFLSGGAPALKIIGPGYIQSDSSMTTGKGAIINWANESYMALFAGGIEDFIQAGPRGKECFPITAAAVAANILTITCVNTFAPAEIVYLSGLAESFLNGQKVTVATATGASFTVNPFVHANFTNNVENGTGSQNDILASSTLNLPDLADGSSTPNSGYLVGISATDYTAASGHCGFFSGGKAGIMHDSGIGCNQSLILPSAANSFSWKNGANQNNIVSAAIVGNTTWTLPVINGTVASNPPPVAGTTDLGTTALPFGNLWLGTAATNNFKFQPAATGQAVAVSLLDPKAATAAISWQGGIPCTNGELVLSAGWGTTATVTAVVGLGWSCEWTVTSSGTGQAANPTLTDTLVLPVLSASVACEMRMVGGSGTATLIDQTTLSATAPIFTFLGMPVAASTYKVYRRC